MSESKLLGLIGVEHMILLLILGTSLVLTSIPNEVLEDMYR